MKIKNISIGFMVCLALLLVCLGTASATEPEKMFKFSVRVKVTDSTMETEYYTYEGYDIPLYYEVFTDFTADLTDVEIVRGLYGFTQDLSAEYQFRAQLLDLNKNLIQEVVVGSNFRVFSSPPLDIDEPWHQNNTWLSIYFNYVPEASYFRLYYNDALLLEEYFSDLSCNNNRECDGSENYYSCPTDCEINAADGVCVNAGEELGLVDEDGNPLEYWNDGYCDPDCYNDDDCEIWILQIFMNNQLIYLDAYYLEQTATGISDWLPFSIEPLGIAIYGTEWFDGSDGFNVTLPDNTLVYAVWSCTSTDPSSEYYTGNAFPNGDTRVKKLETTDWECGWNIFLK